MASCPDWGVVLYLYIAVTNSSEEVVMRSLFFGCRDGKVGTWRRIVKKWEKGVKK